MRKKPLRKFARITCRLTGEEPLRFLNLCRQKEIPLQDLKKEGDAYVFSLAVQDYVQARHLRYVTGVHLDILKKSGFPFWLKKMSARRILFAAVFVAFFLLWMLYGYIWDIRISGNLSYSSETILRYLKSEQIQCGIKKSRVDTAGIAAGLRSHFPHLVWVSAEKRGTVLYIQMEEARQTHQQNETDTDSSLYADKEGKVASIVVRNGIRQVEEGDYVYPGQLLISGEIPLQDDGGNITEYTYCHADGDVALETAYVYYDRLNYAYTRYVYGGKKLCGLQLGTPGQILRLMTGKQTGSMQAVSHPLRLSEAFILPLSVTLYYDSPCQKTEAVYTKEEAAALLQAHFSEFFMQLAKKVLQISENNVKIALYQEYAVAYGIVYTREATGISSYTPKHALQERTTTTND